MSRHNILEKAGVGAGVACIPVLNHLHQQGIVITIGCNGYNMLVMAACGALVPQLLP